MPKSQLGTTAPGGGTNPHSPGIPMALRASLLGLSLAVSGLPVTVAQAQESLVESKNYSIPAGPLGQSLNRFASQAGITLSFTPAMTEGKRAPALSGSYTPLKGLQTLLRGSGLTLEHTGNQAYRVKQVVHNEKSGPVMMAPILVMGDQTAYGRVEGYNADTASVGTKTTAPIEITPVSVQSVPREVIEDQAAEGLEDIYKNVSGVVQTGDTLNASSEVLPVIRGFESPVLLRDGMRANRNGGGLGAADLVNVDSIQVLKGPASILYGALDPGGVLSYTTKKPQPEPSVTLEQELGSYDHIRTTLDATGPINQKKTVMYRFAAAYTDSESFRDDVYLERTAVAPSLLFEPSDATAILLEASYSKEETPYDSGVPLGFDDEKLVDNDTFFGQDNLEGRILEDSFITARLEHDFNPNLTMRTQLQYHDTNATHEGLRNRGVRGTTGSEVLRRRYQNERVDEQQYELVNDLVVRFETGSVLHELLVGININDSDFTREFFRQNLADIPITNNPPQNFVPPLSQTPGEIEFTQDWKAIYLQEQAHLFDDRLHVTANLRYDDFEQTNTLDGTAQPNVEESDRTSRVGALYELTGWVSPYASYAESFVPQNSLTRGVSGDVLPPEEGEQFEVGLKFDFFQGRLAATLAAYEIEKDNVGSFDLATFLNQGIISFLPESQRSRGVELDVSGRLTDRLQVIANYAYTDTEVLSNDADPTRVGEELGNVPEHSARLFVKYGLPSEVLRNVDVFGGFNYEGERKAAFDDTELDSFVTVDVGASYEFQTAGGQELGLQLNVSNLFDKDYFVRASDQSIVHPGAPRQVKATLRVSF